MPKKFSEAKEEFDARYRTQRYLKYSIVPVNGKTISDIEIHNSSGQTLEEYFKWQFIYSLIHSDLFSQELIGVEVSMPKGNPSSKPIKIDGAVFDDKNWLQHYEDFWKKKKQTSLDWLRNHIIAVIEFKKSDGRDIEKYFNQQLKPAMKESDMDYVIGFYYDNERLWIFQKKNGKVVRYDESRNENDEQSNIRQMSLYLPDSYLLIPSFSDITSVQSAPSVINRANRSVADLDKISGVHTRQLKDALSNVLRKLVEIGLLDQIGYSLLVQMLALKIYDEKVNTRYPKKNLRFYITDVEKSYKSLMDPPIQGFINRIHDIHDEARLVYAKILGDQIINWSDSSHISAIARIVESFQDFSFTEAYKSDLYQLVFYRFANEFAKERGGQFITPIWLIDFLVKIVNPRGGETVVDPCVGIADFLAMSYVNADPPIDDSNLYGFDNDKQMIMLAQLNVLLSGDGNARLLHLSDMGSLNQKLSITGNPVKLDSRYHSKGRWDNWPDGTEIMKFDVVLTNPPFGKDRAFRVGTSSGDNEVAECYQLWDMCKQKDWIDPGLLFLENAVHLLKENGRLGIVLSNSIASVERWEQAREWLLDQVRIVALFDLPKDVFADTGVPTTLIVAYKPDKKELERLKRNDYRVFVRDIQNVGYEVRTTKRVKFYSEKWKIDHTTFEIETDIEGRPVLDEDFSKTIIEFRSWAKEQEPKLSVLFIS